MKHISVILAFLLVFWIPTSLKGQQQQVDAGIFPGLSADTLIIKARPDFNIAGQSLTNTQLTLKWREDSPVSALEWLGSPVGLFPQGGVITANGFRYQVYASFGGSSLSWSAGQEYTLLRVATGSTTGDCTEFGIAQDGWTAGNNGDYYFEILGEDKTGILYEPTVHFGSDGGFLDGDTTIYLGGSTGPLSLINYNGNIVHWERRINQGAWTVLPGTAGLEQYEEIPTLEGTWAYQVRVEKPGCPAEYSEAALVTVELLAIWTGAVNSDFNNPGNWSLAGVPNLQLDGQIPFLASEIYPDIQDESACKNLIIDPGAETIISAGGRLTVSGWIRNEGRFEIQADTLSSGSLLDQGIIGGGQFVSSFELQPGYWHVVATPVTGAIAGAFDGIWLYEWEEASAEWIQITNPDDSLENFRGYMALNAATPAVIVLPEGNGINTGPVQMELTNSGAGNGHTRGFHLLGNPYPSAINWNATDGWMRENIDPAIYVFNGRTGNYGTYLFNDPGSSTLGIDSIIAANQGFFVHVNSGSPEGVIGINNNARLHDLRPIPESPALSSTPYLKLRVHRDENHYKDEAVVRFRPGASPLFDAQWDAYDVPGSDNALQIFTRCPDTLRLAVNTFPELTVNRAVAMGFIPGEEGEFNLEVVAMEEFGTDTIVLLEDLIYEQVYNLQSGLSLNLPSSHADDIDRFMLHFRVEPVGILEQYPTVAVHSSGDAIMLEGLDSGFAGQAEVFDMTGRLILRQEIVGAQPEIRFPELNQVLLLRISGNKMSISRKIFH